MAEQEWLSPFVRLEMSMMYVRMVYTSKSKKVLFQFKKKQTPRSYLNFNCATIKVSEDLQILVS